MNETLFMKLVDYRILKEFIKTNKSPLKSILIRSQLQKMKKSIASMIDDDIITFKELYKLFKILEQKSLNTIYFQIYRFYYEDNMFEEPTSINGIRIIKEVNGKKEIMNIFFNSCLFDSIYGNIIDCEEISVDDLSMVKISNLLFKIKILYEEEYDKLINLIIAYLIKREKI